MKLSTATVVVILVNLGSIPGAQLKSTYNKSLEVIKREQA